MGWALFKGAYVGAFQACETSRAKAVHARNRPNKSLRGSGSMPWQVAMGAGRSALLGPSRPPRTAHVASPRQGGREGEKDSNAWWAPVSGSRDPGLREHPELPLAVCLRWGSQS